MEDKIIQDGQPGMTSREWFSGVQTGWFFASFSEGTRGEQDLYTGHHYHMNKQENK